MKRFANRLIAAAILALILPLRAEVVFDSIRSTDYDFACARSGEIVSKHQRQDKAMVACQNAKLSDPDTDYEVISGRWRIVLNIDALADISVKLLPNVTGATFDTGFPNGDRPPTGGDEGFIVFASATGSVSELTTDSTTVKFRRIISGSGAVAVDVDDTVNGTCVAGSDYNTVTPTTFNWADTEFGGGFNKFLTITLNDISANCTIEFEFESLTGGIQAYTERQQMMVTVLANPIVTNGDLFVLIGGAGSDANDCTAGTPCATIGRAAGLAVPGDIIEIQVNGTGAGTYTQCTTLTTNGLAGNRIELRVRAGDTVTIDPAGACDAILEFAGADYWYINGSVGGLILGDVNDWSNANNGKGYPHHWGIYATGSHHVEIDSITIFGGAATGAINEPTCNKLEASTNHWYFHDNTFDLCGTNHTTASEDRGDLFRVLGHHHIFENNNFSHGGHSIFRPIMRNSVVRGNTFDADWTDKNTGSPGGRAGELVFGADDEGSVAPHGPNLAERNIFKNAGASGDNANNPILKVSGFRTIYRQNLHCTNQGAGIRINQNNGAFTLSHTVESQRFYNNTFIDSGGFISLKADRATVLDNIGDHRFINNLGDNFTVDATWLIEWDNNSPAQQGYPNDWHGAIIRKNWLHSDNYAIRMSALGGSTTNTFFAAAEAAWPNVFSNNAKTRATYVNRANCDFTGLALDTGSNGIDAAAHLTTVTSSSTGTALVLEDAWFFYDGFGLEYGEVGDYIAIYNPAKSVLRGIRQVTAVNSQTSLTVSSAITVTAGDIVFLVESDGTTVVDSMGAVQ